MLNEKQKINEEQGLKEWELLIVDAAPPVDTLDSLAIGDINGDGKLEIVSGGHGALLYYTVDTYERNIISEGTFNVGLVLEDIDGDGIPEIIASRFDQNAKVNTITWFKYDKANIAEPWTMHYIDQACAGDAHDIIFADIDGDGENELIAVAAYTATPGIYAYKKGDDLKKPWIKHQIMNGIFTEGLCAADLNNDGKLEIISGPDIYICPEAGPFSGNWERRVVAPGLREMCRSAVIDITGNGKQDIILVESEYGDGKLSWFENRMEEDPENPWKEHVIAEGLVFAHSLYAWKDDKNGKCHIFTAEMEKGGFGADYNYDARLIEYVTCDKGASWKENILYKGMGTHQATVYDIDNDGEYEIIGKTWGKTYKIPRLQIWKKTGLFSQNVWFNHKFIDRDKPYTGTDILTADVDGDGLDDIICGSWWYKNPTWQRFEIPGIYQVINSFDIDGDGRKEFIATKRSDDYNEKSFYSGLTSILCWIKPIDPLKGKWIEYPIGEGLGDWPHGSLIGPFLPEGRLALITGYHSAQHVAESYPEIFEMPMNPEEGMWPKRILAEIPYGEEMVACDINNDGKLDIVAGSWWLENMGDGTFMPYKIAEGFEAARVCVGDINKDGRPDIVASEEIIDFKNKVVPYSRLVWLENPEGSKDGNWKIHVIDKVRCGHSLSLADIDGDGELEIICGEHDPFMPYRTRCKLMIYKKGNKEGTVWYRKVIDSRFEHHDGAKVVRFNRGHYGIISHAWKEGRYVHLWEIENRGG